MKANVYRLDGTVGKQIELPAVFSEKFRPDLIKRAYLAVRSNQYQPHGTYKLAGMETSAAFFGRRHKVFRSTQNKGISRLPRVKLTGGRLGEVKRIPQSRGGRRAHPPKVEKTIVEKINKKERRKAIRSAIAATAQKSIVAKRGHKVQMLDVPIIIDDSFSDLKKTSEVIEVLMKLKLADEMARAEKRTLKAGKGKLRGRVYRKKKTVLIITGKDSEISKAAKSIPGVDVCAAKDLNAELLAPGGDAGRLAIYSESAMKELEKLFK
ncbi:MAG: 50S ribosomal protein L4 [Candidatus Micrarchaeota archaeon]